MATGHVQYPGSIRLNSPVLRQQFDEVKRYLEKDTEYRVSDSQVMEALLRRYLDTEKADIIVRLPKRVV